MDLTGAAVLSAALPEFAPVGSLPDGDRTGTLVLTAAVYLLALVALGRAAWLARRGRWIGLGCLLGAFVVSWGEALYDAAFHLAFYAEGMTLWSPFGVAQPWWVPPGYTASYGVAGWLVAERILAGAEAGGVTRARIARFLVVAWLGCAAFETVAHHLGVLRYFDNTVTVFGMPYWHEMFNAVFIVLVGIAVAAVQPVLRGASTAARLAVPVAIYLLGFTGVTYGAGFLALAAHNSAGPPALIAAGAVAGNVVALLVLVIAVDLLGTVPAYRAGLAGGPRLLRFDRSLTGTGTADSAVGTPGTGGADSAVGTGPAAR